MEQALASILDTLAEDVSSALTGALRSATYWRYAIIGRNEFNEPEYGWASYTCEGVRGTFDVLLTGTGTVPLDAAKIEILASSLAVEVRQGDRINIDDSWWSISRIERDPAGAWWTCQCGESEAAT